MWSKVGVEVKVVVIVVVLRLRKSRCLSSNLCFLVVVRQTSHLRDTFYSCEMWTFLLLSSFFHPQYFTSQREEFENTRENLLVWLTDLDLQLTNVEHFSESDVHHKIQQLNVRMPAGTETPGQGHVTHASRLCLSPAELPEGDHAEHGAHWRTHRVWRRSDPEKFTAGRSADRGRAGGAAHLLPRGFRQTGPLPPAPQPAPGQLELTHTHCYCCHFMDSLVLQILLRIKYPVSFQLLQCNGVNLVNKSLVVLELSVVRTSMSTREGEFGKCLK